MQARSVWFDQIGLKDCLQSAGLFFEISVSFDFTFDKSEAGKQEGM